MLDDVLDVTGPAERTGKRRGADLLDGTVTLPLILARESSPSSPRSICGRSAERPRREAICTSIEATGAGERARRVALDLVATAKRELPAACPPLQRRALELMADGLVERFA